MTNMKRLGLVLMVMLLANLALVGLVAGMSVETEDKNIERKAAAGTTITVTTADDELNSDGDCSLREALEAANTDAAVDNCSAGDGWDIISVPAGNYVLTLIGAEEDANATGDLDVLESVTIIGAGAEQTILDGNATDRVLHVDPTLAGVVLDLSDVTVTNGGNIVSGGGLYQVSGMTILQDSIVHSNIATDTGGGIQADLGTMRILSTTIENNQTADEMDGFGGGLAIYSSTVEIVDSSFISNVATEEGGAIYSYMGSLTIENSEILSNTADPSGTGFTYGGGISSYTGNLDMSESQVSYNTADRGGGIYTEYGIVQIEDSTVSHNVSARGGGIDAADVGVILKNTLIEYNRATDELGTTGRDVGVGGGVYLEAGGLIESTTIQHNHAEYGGGLYGDEGGLSIFDSIVYSNTADEDGGGIFSDILNIDMKRTIVRDNTAVDEGGGLYGSDAYPVFFIEDSWFDGNQTDGDGGGIFMENECGLYLLRSTLSGNRAENGGGLKTDSSCGIDIQDSTISGNTAEYGGGIYVGDSSVVVALENSTLSNNTATAEGGGIYMEDGSGSPDGFVTVKNSIMAGNTISGTLVNGAADCTDPRVSVTTGGYNIFGDGTGCMADDRYDQAVDPTTVATTILEPLADNGGALLLDGSHPPTHLLRQGSPAVDAAGDLLCSPADQLGTPRPAGNGCDIGAVESDQSAAVPAPLPNLITVDTTVDDLTDNGNCTLREAIQAANTDTAIDNCAAGDGWDTIVLDDLTYTLSITGTSEDENQTGDLDVITGSVTIRGAGQQATTIDGGEVDRVFDLGQTTFGTTIFEDLTVTNGLVPASGPSDGGCVNINAGLLVFVSSALSQCTADYGGGIASEYGTVRLVESLVQANVARVDGGGVAVYDAPLTILDSAIVSNTAVTDEGGGIYRDHAFAILDHTEVYSNVAFYGGGFNGYEAGIIVRNDSHIHHNAAVDDYGGGLYAYSLMVIENSRLNYNEAKGYGGGIYAEYGLRLENSTVEFNQSGPDSDGGGIYLDVSGWIISSTIRHNESISQGGGIHLEDGNLIVDSSLIYSNTAEDGGGISNEDGPLLLRESMIRDNVASRYGGAIYYDDVGGRVENSTLAGNQAVSGTVYIHQGPAEFVGSTISGNQADQGGGVYSREGVISLLNSTVSGNNATEGGGLYSRSDQANSMIVRFSTVASNTAANGAGGIHNGFTTVIEAGLIAGNSDQTDTSPDCLEGQPIASAGYSLFGENTGCVADGRGDQTVDPAVVFTDVLGPLQDNGGGTLTHALQPGSPALNLVPADMARCGTGVTTDQRGVVRPQDDHCDAGAVEAAQTVLTVTVDGSGSGTVTGNGIDCGSDCSESYQENTVVTLTAAAEAGSTFVGWSGACSGTSDCMVTMSASQNVTATFTMDQQLVVTKAGSGQGSVTSNPAGIDCGVTCDASFTQGTVVTLTASADSNSIFVGWSGACSGTGDCVVTMTAAQNVTATFNARSIYLPFVVRP